MYKTFFLWSSKIKYYFNSASLLNFDLFRVGIVSDPSCPCGPALENLKHFFLDCPIYIQARTILIGTINRVTTCYTLDIELLTCGNDNLTDEQNCIIFKYVMDKMDQIRLQLETNQNSKAKLS
jgi:hypothetical protein